MKKIDIAKGKTTQAKHFQISENLSVFGDFSESPKLLDLNQEYPSKIFFFFCQILFENCGYNQFSYRNATITKLWPHDHRNNII